MIERALYFLGGFACVVGWLSCWSVIRIENRSASFIIFLYAMGIVFIFLAFYLLREFVRPS
jgi:hypothetical protein